MNIIIKDKRFNTIILKKIVLRPLNKDDQTIRILLSYYLNLACSRYPTESLFDIFLGENYDLGYSVNVNNVGKTSIMSFQLTGVNSNLIDDIDYTDEKIKEIFDIVLSPVIVNDTFSDEIFNKAKETYIANLYYSLDNNKQGIAINKAISLYFKGTLRDYEPDGNIDVLKSITKDELYKYYLSTINDEEISYFVGNVSDTGDNKFTIKPKIDNFFRERPKKTFKYEEIKASTKQCYLEVIYDLQVFPDNSLFYAATMINYRFGGGVNSLLFREIREKHGLCYSINSTYYGGSGIIIVSAIIDKKDEKTVLDLIDEQFNDILSNFNLEDYKKHFRLANKGKKENMSVLINEHLMDNFFPELIPSYCDNKEIKNTKMTDIQECYKKMKKKLVLSYGGE